MRARSWLIVLVMFSTFAVMYAFLGRRRTGRRSHRAASGAPAHPRAPTRAGSAHGAGGARGGDRLPRATASRGAPRAPMREYLRDHPGRRPARRCCSRRARRRAGAGGRGLARYLEGRPWLDERARRRGLVLARAGAARRTRRAGAAPLDGVRALPRARPHAGGRATAAAWRGAAARPRPAAARRRGRGGGASCSRGMRRARAGDRALAGRAGRRGARARAATPPGCAAGGRRGGAGPRASAGAAARAPRARYEEAGDPRGRAALALAFARAARERRGARGARAARRPPGPRAGRHAAAARASSARPLEALAGAAARRGDAAALLGGPRRPHRGRRLAHRARVSDRHGANRAAAARLPRLARRGGGHGGGAASGAAAAWGALSSTRATSPGPSAALEPLAAGSGPRAPRRSTSSRRAEYRRGKRSRALATFVRLAERYPGSRAGLRGALPGGRPEPRRAARWRARRALYRRVATEFRGTDRAGLSLMRLGGHRLPARRLRRRGRRVGGVPQHAIRAGERWLQSTYWAAAPARRRATRPRARALLPRRARAGAALLLLPARRPSGWASRSGPSRWDPSPQRRPRRGARGCAGWMRGVDLLRDAGLHDEAEAEVDRVGRPRGRRPGTPLPPRRDARRARATPCAAIRIGLPAPARRRARPNARLLRILYPFPYRRDGRGGGAGEGAGPLPGRPRSRGRSRSSRRGSPRPWARAASCRSCRRPAGSSPAPPGSTTGTPELLYQPEINAHLGTRYLADQMRQYDGSLPSVFSAYNAGPHRVDAVEATSRSTATRSCSPSASPTARRATT